MKKKLTTAVALVVVFAVGSLFGGAVPYLLGGYSQEVLKTESFPFPGGKITLSYIIEYKGMQFLDPETSVITLTNKYGGLPIILYKAKRVFQESVPQVRDVKIESNHVAWQDGINTYNLAIKPIKEETEQGESTVSSKAAPNASPDAR